MNIEADQSKKTTNTIEERLYIFVLDDIWWKLDYKSYVS